MASVQSKTSKAGKKTHYVVLAIGGKRKWIKAGSRQEALKLKKQIESLEDSKRNEKLGLTTREVRVDDFFQEYADHVRLRCAASTVQRYLGILNSFLVFLRMFHPTIKNLAQIKQEHIESYQKERMQSHELKQAADGEGPGAHKCTRLPSPQTVNFEISVLRTAFMWALDRELIPKVPTKKVKPLKPDNGKQGRVLSAEECGRFLKAAKALGKQSKSMLVYYRAFQFLLNSGLRSGELCNLTWDDIDLKNGLITIQAKEHWSPKTYARQFYLNDVCLGVLKSLDTTGHYVFEVGGRQLHKNKVRMALIKAAKAAGIEGFTRVHDLRHTFSSLMQMQGVDRGTVAAILGHRDLSTTLIYTHQTQEHLRKSINSLALK